MQCLDAFNIYTTTFTQIDRMDHAPKCQPTLVRFVKVAIYQKRNIRERFRLEEVIEDR